MSKNTITRSFLKTITYRILGTSVTILIGYKITENFKIGLAIGSLDVIMKMLLYFVHERIWQNIDYGKKD